MKIILPQTAEECDALTCTLNSYLAYYQGQQAAAERFDGEGEPIPGHGKQAEYCRVAGSVVRKMIADVAAKRTGIKDRSRCRARTYNGRRI